MEEEQREMRENRKWIIALAVLAMLIAACGGTAETTTTAGATTTTEGATTTAPPDTEPPADLLTDVGVDDDEIRVGLLADLTGIFSPLVQDIVAAQEAYWELRNAEGGIGGRQVRLVIEDTNYNVDQHIEKYEALRGDVVMLGQSTGSPHTSRLVQSGLLEEDNMATIALTWYSGWADPSFDGGFVLEKGTNYCLESMNIVGFLSDMMTEQSGEPTSWAVVSFPGEYGQDGAVGAKLAIEALGPDRAELVYDGEGLVTPDGADPETEIINGIVNSGADVVFTTMNPTNLGVIMGGAAQSGFQGAWTGNVPSYDFRMLDTALADFLTAAYFLPAYSVPWGTDVAGMQDVIDAMLEATPDRRPSDAFITGWQEAMLTDAVLSAALESGDMTRAGVVAAANSLSGISFNGLAPDQNYAGSPNDFVVREIAMFRPDRAVYDEAGGTNQTIGSAPDGGTTGAVLLEDFFVHDIAADYQFDGACFTG
jgi:ABC-type branched-subunit amino acid transport system substrate-binding protein